MSSNRVLVVEDEPTVASFVAQALEEAGFEAVIAEDGQKGLDLMKSNNIDLAILDVMLPGLDGLEVLTRARASGVTVPILMLTALGELDDRVRGLNEGADDYLAKPFKIRELLARVAALIRRSSMGKTTAQVEDLKVDFIARRVERAGRTIFLSTTEFLLLEILVRNAGSPVSKKEILEYVWASDHDRDANIVEVYVNHLRTKLEFGGAPRMIHTVRRVGYMLGKPY